MTSTLSVAECRAPVTSREGSYPHLGAFRSKVSKVCHLSSVSKTSAKSWGSLGPDVYPLQGVSLLSAEPSSEIYNVPQNTSRTQQEQQDRRHAYYVNSTVSTESYSDEEERPLSVVGERFSSLSKRSVPTIPSSPGLQTVHNCQNDSSNRFSQSTEPYYNTDSLSCDESLFNEPEVPPPSPSDCFFSSFKIDGTRIGAVSDSRIPHVPSKDFIPGYVRRTCYCCDKCADRMAGHEAMLMEAGSQFFGYQRYTGLPPPAEHKTESESTVSDDDFRQFLNSSLSCTQEEQRIQRLKLLGYKDTEGKENENLKEGSNDTPKIRNKTTKEKVSTPTAQKSLMNETVEGSNNYTKISKTPKGTAQNTTEEPEKESDIQNEKAKDSYDQQLKSSHSKSETRNSKEAETEWSCADDIGSQSDIEPDSPLDKDNDITLDKEPRRKSSHYWSETWPLTISNSQEIKISASHSSEDNYKSDILMFPEITVKVKDIQDDTAKRSEGDRNYNTCDDASSQQDHVYCRERVEQVLQECAEVVDIPKRSFLPDIPMVNSDVCYAAMVDKRYNRWKRRRRKRTRESITPMKLVSPCESSSEEIKDTLSRDSPPVTLKLRRRKREEADTLTQSQVTSHELHYDGSSEMTVSDKDMQHSMYALNDHIHNKSSESKDSIEEHQGRISAAIEQTAKETLKVQMDIFDRQSPVKKDDSSGKDQGSSFLQTLPVPLVKKDDVSDLSSSYLQTIPVPLVKKDVITPPVVSPCLSGRQDMPKIKPSKLPNFKSPMLNHKKYLNAQNNEPSFPKPLERNLVFHASSETGSSLLKYVVGDENMGKPRGQSTGLVKIRMDKHAKERLLMSKIAHNKSIGNSRPLSDNSKREAMKSLKLHHLLQTFPKSSSNVNESDHQMSKKMDSQSDNEMLSPRIVSLQPKSDSHLQEIVDKKQRTKMDRRKCIALKKGSVISLRKQHLVAGKKAVDFRVYEELESVSSMSFTPAFTYSLFELPEIYKKYNKEIERRASMAYSMEEKFK